MAKKRVIGAPANSNQSAWRRLLPKSVLGVTSLVLAFSLGAASVGAILYTYYQDQLKKTERKVTNLVGEFDARYQLAMGRLEAKSEEVNADIDARTGPLKALIRTEESRKELLDKVSASVWFISTLDENGGPAVGSGFVVASDAEQTYLVTSYTTVKAATRAPAPAITASRTGDDSLTAKLWSWQPERDLAILILPRGGQAKIPWRTDSPLTSMGERIYGISGLGAAGGAVDEGFVLDFSADAIQTSLALGASFQGGPVLNAQGEVLGVMSRSFSPSGFVPLAGFYSTPISTVCEKLLSCNNEGASGAQGEGETATDQNN